MTKLIDHNAKAAEYDRLADTIAKDLIPWKQDAPRFASQLIRNGTVNLLMMIASIFDKPLDDILKDRDTVAELANAGFFSEIMEKVLERIDVKFNIALIALILDEPFTGKKLCNWIMSIQADFMRCVTYFIYEGATPDCCRKYIDKKTDKKLVELRKTMTLDDFLTLLSRSLHVLNYLRAKLFTPTLDALEAERVKACQNMGKEHFNSMAAAFAIAKERI